MTTTSKDEVFEAMMKAARHFVNKVETGKARSKESYAQFKSALALANRVMKEKI